MAQQLGQVAVGTIVKLNENGSPANYIVVHIGNPDVRLYGSSCDGVWLLRQDIVENCQWSSTNINTLPGSTIMTTMAGHLAKYEDYIQSAIKTVKIPYCLGNGSANVNSGENGLECKLFPLGGYEVGLGGVNRALPIDGAKLDYFEAGIDAAANNKRVANLNSAAAIWWARSAVNNNTNGKFYIMADGSFGSTTVSPSYGARPAMVMDPTILVSDDGTVGIPAAPASLNVPIQAMQGKQITVSWTAVDGVSSYILERKANTDADWAQVYSGANTSFEETVGTWTSVQYRVKSFANGKYGDYTTSASVAVVPVSILIISGSDGSLGTLVNDVQYSVSSSGTSALTVTEIINGVTTRTYTAVNGATNKLPVMDLPTGNGTIKITASTNPGSGVVTVTRNWTYSKTAPTFADTGSTAQLQQKGKNVFPLTLLECVRGVENLAPGGYGLGGNCVTIEDWNTAIKNGWYRNTTSDPGDHTPDGSAWYGFVVNYTDTLIIQVAFHANSPTNIKSAIRTCHAGTWGEWQYTTPPRSIGVEYRIPELYNNAPVYTKVINFGAAPNATSKTLGHGIASFGQCVEISGNIGRENLIGHPHITGVNVTASGITIETDADLSGNNVYVILKYTKTSN